MSSEEQAILTKKAHKTGPRGIWATFNMEAAVTASRSGYLLTITGEQEPRLDKLSSQQEEAFWSFNFAQGKNGLQKNAETKYFPKFKKAGYERKAAKHFMCAVNDGPAAWQSVGHVHGHVIWLGEEYKDEDIESRIMTDRINASDKKSATPLGRTEIPVSSSLAKNLREARQSLLKTFGDAASPDRYSFSIYTKKPVENMKDATMVVELWSDHHHSIASVSTFIRFWEGLRDKAASGYPAGIRYKGFQKA